MPSRFLREIPPKLVEHKGAKSRYMTEADEDADLELFGERFEGNEAAKKNVYTGQTYNSVENVRGFFEQRGISVPAPPQPQRQTPPVALPQPRQPLFGGPQPQPSRPPGSVAYGGPPKQQPVKRPGSQHVGSVVQHPKYGRGTVLRQEGDGEDAKLTVSFPGYGLKKLIAKLAGLKP